VATGLGQLSERAEERSWIVDVLHHFHGANDIKLVRCSAFFKESLGRDVTILQATVAKFRISGGVKRSYLYVVSRGIYSSRSPSHASKALGKQTASTANIKHIKSTENAMADRCFQPVSTLRFGKFVSNELNANRVHVVKWLELSLFVPPLG